MESNFFFLLKMNDLMIRKVLFFLLVVKLGHCINVKRQFPTENRYMDFFQGDILMRNITWTLDRFATTQKTLRWPNGVVPYIIDDTYTEDEKELLRIAMDEFEKKTCIKWIERTDQDYYVEIYSDMGCWAELGRVGGVQSLSLQSPACMAKGVVMHEMMHALGFLHEQARHDRDHYVTVNWDNVIEGMEPNFEKLPPLALDDLGLDYDYRSIMHYRAWAFAKDRSVATLRTRTRGVFLEDLGSAQEKGVLTNLDIQKINKFYEC